MELDRSSQDHERFVRSAAHPKGRTQGPQSLVQASVRPLLTGPDLHRSVTPVARCLPRGGLGSSSCWLGAFGADSRHWGASPATCSIKMISIALLPEDAALRIHFGDIVALIACHQDIPVGQPAGARWVRQLD